jgi:hypothetical protein
LVFGDIHWFIGFYVIVRIGLLGLLGDFHWFIGFYVIVRIVPVKYEVRFKVLGSPVKWAQSIELRVNSEQ